MLSTSRALYELSDKTLFWSFAILSLLAMLAAAVLYTPEPILLPIGMLFLLFSLNNPKALFYLFFAILPFSIEIHVGSLGTDLPSEPIMVFMMGLCMVLATVRSSRISKDYFVHPISLVVISHLMWIFLTSITSTSPVISFKFLLAKMWYVLPFFFLPLLLMRREEDFRKVFKFLSVGLFIAITYVLIRHAAAGFTFDSSNTVMRPIFRNHVNYAVMLVAFLPYYWYLLTTASRRWRLSMLGLLGVLLIGIYFSYTRAAQASVFLAIAFYWLMKLRLMKLSVGLGIAGLIVVSLFLSVNNRYLDFAPDFERTVAHKKFDNLVEATAKMEDISTVERFYRWVAGGYMLKEKPWLGYGPSTFYSQYRAHTVTSYKTYVSDNPEKSGIHNNYLMVAVEQGLLGLVIMLMLAVVPLLYAEKVYHALSDTKEKALVMAAATCYFLVDVCILINDLLEADKIGPLYFLSAAIILFFGVRRRH